MRRVARLAGLAALTVACAGCSSGPIGAMSDHTITVTADFDNGAGLYVGNAVSVLGMPVGKVESISPKGSYVEVKLSVDAGVPIPATAQAVTVSTSILTDRHVEFTPAYKDGPTLRDGAVLGPGRTRTPVEFDQVLAMATKLSQQLEGDRQGHGAIADLLDVGASMTSGGGADIKSALDQLSRALQLGADHGAATKDAITSIVTDLSQLSDAAARNDTTIQQFGAAVHQVSDVLASEDLGTGDTGARIDQILQEAQTILQDNRGNLKSTVSGAATVAAALSDYQRQLAEFVDLAPLLMDNGYNAFDFEKRGVRVHALLDKVFFDGQMVKEVCNILGLRQLGCSTGTLQDMGPDFGVPAMLQGMAELPK